MSERADIVTGFLIGIIIIGIVALMVTLYSNDPKEFSCKRRGGQYIPSIDVCINRNVLIDD